MVQLKINLNILFENYIYIYIAFNHGEIYILLGHVQLLRDDLLDRFLAGLLCLI